MKQIISSISLSPLQTITIPKFMKRVNTIWTGLGLVALGAVIITYNLKKLEEKELPEIL